MFYNGFQVFLMCFCKCFRCLCSSVSSDFRRMLQVLHLDVSIVDQVLHLHPRFLLPRLGVSSSSRRWLGIRCPLPFFLDIGDVRGVPDSTWVRETAVGTGVWTPHPFKHLGTSKPVFFPQEKRNALCAPFQSFFAK
jgi:hypothetical protein